MGTTIDTVTKGVYKIYSASRLSGINLVFADRPSEQGFCLIRIM